MPAVVLLKFPATGVGDPDGTSRRAQQSPPKAFIATTEDILLILLISIGVTCTIPGLLWPAPRAFEENERSNRSASYLEKWGRRENDIEGESHDSYLDWFNEPRDEVIHKKQNPKEVRWIKQRNARRNLATSSVYTDVQQNYTARMQPYLMRTGRR